MIGNLAHQTSADDEQPIDLGRRSFLGDGFQDDPFPGLLPYAEPGALAQMKARPDCFGDYNAARCINGNSLFHMATVSSAQARANTTSGRGRPGWPTTGRPSSRTTPASRGTGCSATVAQ